MSTPIAILEIYSLGGSLAVLDHACKAGQVEVLEAELNDHYGLVVKIAGSPGDLRSAVDAAKTTAECMKIAFASKIMDKPHASALRGIFTGDEYQPLLNQSSSFRMDQSRKARTTMPDSSPSCIGLIETQGFTAVIEAIDTACKAANVEVLGKEKLGGGYITVLISGEVAAVNAAIDAGQREVKQLGKLIAAHVIPRPCTDVMRLLEASRLSAERDTAK